MRGYCHAVAAWYTDCTVSNSLWIGGENRAGIMTTYGATITHNFTNIVMAPNNLRLKVKWSVYNPPLTPSDVVLPTDVRRGSYGHI